MKTLKVKQSTTNSFDIEGDLTFATINKHTPKIMDKLFTPDDITIDLKQVEASDSAGLALIIEWLKIARSRKTKLIFANVPNQLLAIAQLSGFERLFQPSEQLNNNSL